MPYFRLRNLLSQKIAEHLNHPEITAQSLEGEFGAPPKIELGHFALPCFRLSKVLKRPSNEIAKELSKEALIPGLTGKPTGPYVNYKQEVGRICLETLNETFSKAERFGSDSSGKNQKVVIEYCSPNIAKQLAFQHIRSTLIGNTLSNIYDFLDYQTIRLNFVGDWGAQFARLLAAVELWSSEDRLPTSSISDSMKHLFELYVRFHKEIETDESYLERASRCLKSLENQEEKALGLWKHIRKISLISMETTLNRMQVKFDHIDGESIYIPGMDKCLEEIKKASGARLSDGAYIVDIPGIETPALIQKRDGTTLYLTRDAAAAVDRFKRFEFSKMYYVVSEQQKLHFQLLFGLLKKMGFEWGERCEHLTFGTVFFESKKMSTRKGRVVFLDDLLNEAKQLALKQCSEKNPDLKNKDEVAEMVGIGAIIFGELSTHRTRDIRFDWKNILALDGETGPYVQYSLVRCHSLIEKAREKDLFEDGLDNFPQDYEYLIEEETLVITLAKFRLALRQAVRENEPFHLTRYLIELAKVFNRFYYQLPVLQAADPIQRKMRINCVLATQQVLTNGLNLLGIGCPQEM